MASSPFLDRLNHRITAADSLLCVGLDADIARLPERFRVSVTPQYDFNRWIIDQTHHAVLAYKPNIAFYEAQGPQGLRELELTIDYLSETHPDIITICDAKRADIGNTSAQYATALFDRVGFDAVTLHPYLGAQALAPFLDRADRGCIVLCRTSNPEADEFQSLQVDGAPLWERVAVQVQTEWNANGNCMLVVGGTRPTDLRRARALAPALPFLVPGVGAQGGDATTVVQAGQDANGAGLVVNAGRSVIFADDPAAAARALRDTLNAARRA